MWDEENKKYFIRHPAQYACVNEGYDKKFYGVCVFKWIFNVQGIRLKVFTWFYDIPLALPMSVFTHCTSCWKYLFSFFLIRLWSKAFFVIAKKLLVYHHNSQHNFQVFSQILYDWFCLKMVFMVKIKSRRMRLLNNWMIRWAFEWIFFFQSKITNNTNFSQTVTYELMF